MITRDNAASISGTAQNARQRLGELIQHYMDERSMSDQRVSRTCSASPHEVEAWRTGKLVPTSEQWSKLKRSVHHAFGRFAEVYQRARTEEENEARERAAKNMEQKKMQTPQAPKIGTSLGDKLAAAVSAPPKPPISLVRDPDPEPAPQPTPSGYTGKTSREAMAKLPKGWKSAEMLAKRRAFALDILRQRPNIRESGADSLDDLLQRAFGVGLASYTVKELREQVERERGERESRFNWTPTEAPVVAATAPTPTPVPAPVPSPEAVNARVHEHVAATADASADDIGTAVKLILDAIPGLQTFTISVDEHGEASVDYQIRKVKIETVGGSMKVRR